MLGEMRGETCGKFWSSLRGGSGSIWIRSSSSSSWSGPVPPAPPPCPSETKAAPESLILAGESPGSRCFLLPGLHSEREGWRSSEARRSWSTGRPSLVPPGQVEGVPEGALPQHGPDQDLQRTRRSSHTLLTHSSSHTRPHTQLTTVAKLGTCLTEFSTSSSVTSIRTQQRSSSGGSGSAPWLVTHGWT